MSKKLTLSTALVLILYVANAASAVTWTGAGDGNSWNDANNWDGDVPTCSGDGVTVTLLYPPAQGPVIDSNTEACVNRFQGPGYGGFNASDLTMTGGSLTVGRYWRLGWGDAPGIVHVSDGNVTNTSGYSIQMNEGSVFNLSGGIVNSGFVIPYADNGADADICLLNMTGGIINGKDLNNNGSIILAGEGGPSGPGRVNLYSGTIITTALIMDVNSFMDIEAGTMIIDGDVGSEIDGFVDNRWLTAYGGAGRIIHEYDDVNDVTIVTAVARSPYAWGPSPRDREEDVHPETDISWSAGSYTVSHDVYFGTSFDDVNDANTAITLDVYVGNQAIDANSYDPPGILDFDRTYYWRIDQVNDANAGQPDGSPWKGPVWSFTVTDGKARNPNPSDGEWRALVNTDMEWTPGALATEHDIYLGTDFNDVNDATTASAVYKTTTSQLLYGPNSLKPNTTYYWRIDEVGTATFVKGDVWIFTTATLGETVMLCDISTNAIALKEGWILISPDDACSYDSSSLTWEDVNSSGIDVTLDTGEPDALGLRQQRGEMLGIDYYFANDQSGPPEADMLITLSNLKPGDYILTAFHNNSESSQQFISDVTITGGISYSEVRTAMPLLQSHSLIDIALAKSQVLFNATGSEDVTIRYIASEGCEVYLNGWILDYFPPDTRYAYYPTPRDGAKEVPPDIVLRWWPGDYVQPTDAHEIYLGTDWDDVNDATTATPGIFRGSQNRDANSYQPPTLLELTKTYYWRIDEINDSNSDSPWKGNVWSFTTANYVIIDDFESYNDTDNVIYDTWEDGVTNLRSSSVIWWASEPNVHGGSQSLEFLYENSKDWWSGHYWSEIVREYDTAQDWTLRDTRILTLYFFGKADNATGETEEMFVALEDAGSTKAVVTYDGDANDVKLEDWTEWNIALSEFTNVDMNNVKIMWIGFGDPDSQPTPGGDGVVFFDDIRLYPPKCVWPGPPEDLSGNCIVDYLDLKIMGEQWLRSDKLFDTYTEPSPGPVGWWKLDEGSGTDAADDGSGNNDGVVEGSYEWVTGYDGNSAIDFEAGRVLVPDAAELRPTNTVSVCAWINLDNEQDSARVVVKGPDNKEAYALEVDNEDNEDNLNFLIREDCSGDDCNDYSVDNNGLSIGEWTHVAGTYDGTWIKLYINGDMVAESNDANSILLSQDTNDLAIGNRSDDDNREFEGKIDDVRVYDYALSDAQIVYVATDGDGHLPLISIANLSNTESPGSEAVNLKDFAVLGDAWLDESRWP